MSETLGGAPVSAAGIMAEVVSETQTTTESPVVQAQDGTPAPQAVPQAQPEAQGESSPAVAQEAAPDFDDNTLAELEALIMGGGEPVTQEPVAPVVAPVTPAPVPAIAPEPTSGNVLPLDSPLVAPLIFEDWKQAASKGGIEVARDLLAVNDAMLDDYRQAGSPDPGTDEYNAVVERANARANRVIQTHGAVKAEQARIEESQRRAQAQARVHAWETEVSRLAPSFAKSDIGRLALGAGAEVAASLPNMDHKRGAPLAVAIAKSVAQTILQFQSGGLRTAGEAALGARMARSPVTIPQGAVAPNSEGQSDAADAMFAKHFPNLVKRG